MKIALLSDLHANLAALDAVLADVRQQGADRLVCLGDLVGYGPQPNECVERIAQREIPCVAGNHDLIALDRLPADRCIRLARESLAWTREVLSADSVAYLQRLPPRLELPEGIVLAHGSLDDPREYVTRREQCAAQLDQLQREHPGARLLLLGHTHAPLAYRTGEDRLLKPSTGELPLGDGPLLLNPGSIGQSRDFQARARYVLLDLEAGTASFRSLPFDTAACREALRRQGLPPGSCHLPPSPVRAARSAVGRFLRSLRKGKKLPADQPRLCS